MERFTKIFIAAIFLITISSCDRKSCSKVVCASYQTCYEGQCLCPDGYQGANCDSASAYQYAGTWNVTENCGNGIPPNATGYQVYIQPTSNPLYITITNLLNLATVNAQLYNTTPGNEGQSFYIAAASQGGFSIANSYGTYSTASGTPVISLILNYNLNGINYSCQETMYKQ